MLQRSASRFLIAALFGSDDPFKKLETLDVKPEALYFRNENSYKNAKSARL